MPNIRIEGKKKSNRPIVTEIDLKLETVTIMKIFKSLSKRIDICKALPNGVKIAEMKFGSRFSDFIHVSN